MKNYYQFMSTDSFDRKIQQQKISEPHMYHLMADILCGGGDKIDEESGFKQIRCGLGGHRGKTDGWQVVFADYPKYRVTYFIAIFSDEYKTQLSRKEIADLVDLKEELDRMVKLKYGEER